MSATRAEGPRARAGDWAEHYERVHRRLFIALATLAGLAGLVSTPPRRATQLAILTAGVVLLALPHGAIDPWLALDRSGRRPRHVIGFVTGYVALAALVVGLWSLVPVAMLGGFLALSAWHFGQAEVDVAAPGPLGPHLETITRGATPILAPLLLQPEETLRLFATLIGDVVTPLPVGAWTVALSLSWIVARIVSWLSRARDQWASRRRGGFEDLLEEVAVWTLFACLPVLLAFALYFCVGHSLRHGLRVARRFSATSAAVGLRLFLRRSAPVTFATLVLAIGAGWMLLGRFDASTLVQVVFVGLAALTLPHVLLGVPSGSRSARGSGSPSTSTEVQASA